VQVRPSVLLAAVLLGGAAATGAEVELDDPAARLRATREWYGEDVAGRARILDAAQRERDRYAVGQSRGGSRPNALMAGSSSAFVNLGPTRADYAVNGVRYLEIDSGRIRQILAHPMDPDVLLIATAGGGVWKTYTATAPTVLWEPLSDALGSTAVGTLAMDPSNPDILFLGFGDPFDVRQPGITRSTDGGGTWSAPAILTATYPVGTGSRNLIAGTVTDLKVDPNNSLVALATTDAGLFRSQNGGASWEHVPLVVSGASRYYYMWSLAWIGKDTWLAAGQTVADINAPPTPAGDGTLTLFRSTDDGTSWQLANAALPGGDATAQLAGRATLATAQSTVVDPATARVYLLAADPAGHAQLDLFRSDDAGLSFQSLQVNASRRPDNPNPDLQSLNVLSTQAWYNQALLVDPANPDTVFIGGQLAMIRSLDAGRTWSVLSDWLPNNSQNSNIDRPYIHADLHAFAVGANGLFYAGSDGGIAVSPNALSQLAAAKDVTFDGKSNEGLVTHLAYTVVCAPESWPASAQGFVAGGMQDNGTRVRSSDPAKSTTFNQLLGGDGIGLAVSAGTHQEPTMNNADVPNVFFASVAGGLFKSTDGGQNFVPFMTGLAPLPFFVRIIRTPPPEQYLTFSGTPAGVYKWLSGAAGWRNVSGRLLWQDSKQYTSGFTTVDGTPIALRNLAAHPTNPQVWGAVSNRYAYTTADGGALWVASVQPRPPQSTGGAYLLSSIEFDPRDQTGQTYYVTTLATALIDAQNNFSDYPPDFGHVFRTTDTGGSWVSIGAQPVANGGLPNVGADVIKVDPDDPTILYVGTVIGLYRSTDSGQRWSRFGAGSLPLVEVRDICFAPPAATGGSERLTIATYGRGFWQIDTAAASVAGVRGSGDTNFDSRIDGEDLIDLADGFNSDQSSPVYRWQADLVGSVNKIDQDDLNALLAKFGGRP
jgi:photosystem II stability/assembly factor-like uncharacterized protein